MKNYFSISEAAKMAGMTSETLRHYDRIGLVSPCEKDPWTGYRYYSKEEIIRLNTIQALRCMDLSLKEIKAVLDLDSLEKIISFLKQAEKSADEKISRLQYAKSKIQRARADYEKKAPNQQGPKDLFAQTLPERVILLSDTMQYPGLDNLWNYHSHFYDQIAPALRDAFSFEDLAGIYSANGRSRLFAVCLRYPDKAGLTVLPAGTYLCANCTEDTRPRVLERLAQAAWDQYGVRPKFTIQLVVLSGILQWDYQLQVLVGPEVIPG